MKLSELINRLQRFHDLYPRTDPEITLTEVAYRTYDIQKRDPEFFCRSLNEITCFEMKTFVDIPSESLFVERGPYLNIFYEGDVIENPEDCWKTKYLSSQNEIEQTGSTNSDRCTGSTPGSPVDQQTVPRKNEDEYGEK